LAIDENSAEGLLGLASYYALLSEEQGNLQYDLAIETLRKAVTIQPNLTQAANDLAYFLLQSDRAEDVAEAMSILEDVLAKDPALVHANINYTDQLTVQGRLDEVEKALLRWSRLSPELSAPVVRLSGLYLAQGELAQAWNYTSVQAKRFPDSDTLVFNTAIIKSLLSDVDWMRQSPSPDAQAVGLMLGGQEEKALKILTNSAFVEGNLFFAFISLVPAQFAVRDYAALASFYDSRLNDTNKRSQAFACQCAGLAYIAYALNETGHKDAKIFVTEWEAAAEKRREKGEKSSRSATEAGWLAAVRGDGEVANAFFETAIDMGYREPLFLQQKYRLPMRGDDAPGGEYDGAIAKMLLAINVERRELDMESLVLVGGRVKQ